MNYFGVFKDPANVAPKNTVLLASNETQSDIVLIVSNKLIYCCLYHLKESTLITAYGTRPIMSHRPLQVQILSLLVLRLPGAELGAQSMQRAARESCLVPLEWLSRF